MTTAVLGVSRPGALALGRAAAGLALASALVHLLLLDAGSLGSAVMVLMALACLPCAWHLWRSPSASVWRGTALVDAVMLVLHVQMLGGPTSHAAHHTVAPASLMWLGLGMVGGQLPLAAAAALRR